MKKIKIIGIGGTISALHTSKGFKPGVSIKSLLSYIPRVTEFYEIEMEQIMNVDSANLQPEDWEFMASTISDSLNDVTVHGIVVTHGTDTMALSAAAMSILIRDINKPIVFTGSQIPLQIFASDAQRNLIDSIRVAGETDIAEAVIVFNSRIYRGCRTLKLREYDLSAFETVDPFPIGEISRQINIINPFVRRRNSAKSWIDGKFIPKVALIKIFPGLEPKLLEELPNFGYRGIVLEGYGAGNIPIEKRSLVEAINSLKESNIPVIITSVCIFGKTELFLYETGQLAQEAGAISGFDMISEVAMIKLMWVLSKTSALDRIEELMHTNLAGEINQTADN